MKKNPREEAERWWLQALRDYDDARFVVSGDRYNLTCFIAQQCAEKALKAFLYFHGILEIRGHSVAELAAQAAGIDQSFVDLHRRVAVLDQYYIPTRYPNGLPGGIPADAFDKSDAGRALSLAQLVLSLIGQKTGMPGA